MENSNSSALSDGAQQANLVSNENAEAMFGADQAETNMVKLVDGKLTSIGDTEDDVVDGQLANRYSSDEERTLQGDASRGKTYENSDASLHVGTGVDEDNLPNDPIAVGDITGNPDAGSTVATGLSSEDEPTTPTNSFGSWNVIGSSNGFGNYPSGDMIPSTPGSPNPIQPVPGIPETPPTPPVPGPEIPEMPGTPKPDVPEVQDPSEPDRSHEINAQGLSTFTSAAPGVVPTNGPKPDGHVAETKYEGLPEAAKAVPGTEEGMEDKPDTGDSARPYDVNAKDTADNQPGERPEEAKEAQKLPREMADESSIAAQDMVSGPDRSDQKSTEGLDRKYNDPEAAREMAS
ncbi:hypothetical protein EXU85_04530 [Spirosoma sp. KCTC 42546]|uniref:hypothetical protein n=1 Tax=Spirosoma sp. KCTC 42546 TaxID=2520506 RepID=UPI0011593354|nr:hypothetical protein [Spirosoma sp. KCTC 42546]QDK77893.1 hypothetical protein EXU85_04530 [Spirosoma sp. KCTC 42546]